MNRPLTPLERDLRSQPALNAPVRTAAINAVDQMMNDSQRAALLLKQARSEVMRAPAGTLSSGRAAVLAREAYEARTSAEVGKYRAAYTLVAESEASKAELARRAAARAQDPKKHAALVEKAKYHGVRRDLMVAAAKATSKALKRIPPLPAHVTKNAATLPSNHELLASPTLGWRPPAFNNLTGNFYPDDVRAAAGALSDVDPSADNAPQWWTSLQQSLAHGVKATGAAAAEEGQKTSTSNPTGGGALTLGGNLLNTLANMMSGAGADSVQGQPVNTQPDWGTIVLVGGVLSVGGLLLWKVLKGK